MEYRYLGRTGVEVSPVCLGSDDFGDGTPPDLAEKLILRSLDAGINLIDTGNLYAGGTSEADHRKVPRRQRAPARGPHLDQGRPRAPEDRRLAGRARSPDAAECPG